MKARVSVILPSLNVADYIRECMDSVTNQSLQELEMICVDAGSSDGTREILEEYAQKDSRIVILDSHIKSYGRQVNMGLDYASGEYVAVVETDDWIAQDMYRCLYDRAISDRLDYAAADFDTFYQLQSGCSYFSRHYLFHAERRKWYGTVIGPDQTAVLRADDYVLWRGIYNREFLNRNHIRLHESPGAAFQDMGFLQQVKNYARRVEYMDRSFYRYRQGRADASSGCLEGLRYYQEEFRWLNDRKEFTGSLNEYHRKYYYYTMSISFLTKYEQILFILGGNWQDERLSCPYVWFKSMLSGLVLNGFLGASMYEEALWERMVLLLESQEAHACLAMQLEKRKEEQVQALIQMTGSRPVIIFGCGRRGERLMLFCDRNHFCMDSFCDNDPLLHGKKKFGFPVIAPEELKCRVHEKDGVILLSMKKGTNEVRSQLIGLGIGPDRIIDKIPEVIFS